MLDHVYTCNNITHQNKLDSDMFRKIKTIKYPVRVHHDGFTFVSIN